jgi:hypothetical protein
MTPATAHRYLLSHGATMTIETLYRMFKSGEIPAMRPSSPQGRYVVRLHDLDAWLGRAEPAPAGDAEVVRLLTQIRDMLAGGVELTVTIRPRRTQ